MMVVFHLLTPFTLRSTIRDAPFSTPVIIRAMTYYKKNITTVDGINCTKCKKTRKGRFWRFFKPKATTYHMCYRCMPCKSFAEEYRL